MLVLNAVAKVPPSVGAMPNLPVPVNVLLVGRVLFWKINSPDEIAVAPEKVCALVNVSVLLPALVNAPVPEMTEVTV